MTIHFITSNLTHLNRSSILPPMTNALTSKKSGAMNGLAIIPGDKSISHRSLMLGTLTEGETIIHGLLEGEDVMATANAMRAFGATITQQAPGIWRVQGVGIGNLQSPDKPIDMGNSGTSTRLIMGLAASHNITATFTGDESLSGRPMNRVIKPLEQMGAKIEASEGGRLPLTVYGNDSLKAITYETPKPSAQIKSCIILAGLNAKGTTSVIETRLTRNHSENMLRAFGIDIESKELQGGTQEISVTGGGTLEPGLVQVPRDPSSAAFPIVAALINKGSDITCEHIGLSPTRDGLYRTLIEMGADLTISNKRTESGELIGDIHVKGTKTLKGITIPAERVPDMIDEIPILAVAASFAEGTTVMTGLAELRVKECDRLKVTAAGLKAMRR